MAPAIPYAPYFHEERAAYAFVEDHLWRNGRVCPHCGAADRSGQLGGKSTRTGLYKCYACRKPFTVKIGTLFESSNVKLHLWLRAVYLVCCRDRRVSSAGLHESLGVTVKTAWSLRQRIREGERQGMLLASLVAAFKADHAGLPRSAGAWKAKPIQRQGAWSAERNRFAPQVSIPRWQRGGWVSNPDGGALE